MIVLWWHWIVLGLVLAAIEMAAAGGFYIIFFGLAAIVVGVLGAFDLAGPVWAQILIFIVLSVAFLTFFRARLLRVFQGDPQRPAIDSLVGEVGVVLEELLPGVVGKVELRGTAWSARTVTGALAPGTRCRVTRVEGLLLVVEAEGGR